MVGCSKISINTVEMTATVKNCTKLSWMPSSLGLKWSTSKIWVANKKAQPSSCHSPPVRARLSCPARHSRYRPTTLAATQHHSFTPGRRPKSTPNTGTSTTYKAVMNPALAVLVVPMPICCAADAANSAMPQQVPPFTSTLRFCQKPGSAAEFVLPALRSTAISPSRNTQASQLRPARKL